MAYDYEFIKVEASGGIATVYLNRPPVNSLNQQLIVEIGQCALELDRDDKVRAVVITGGQKMFCAGADITMFTDLVPAQIMGGSRAIQASFSAIENIQKPVIAAINGFAVGGGCELAICCDWRYAHEKAVIGQPEILLGVIPAAGGCLRLPRLIGPAKAKEMICSGKFYTAQECFAMGLVQKVIEGNASVIEEAQKVAAEYAKGPAVALAAAKLAVNRGLECSIGEAMVLEQQGMAICYASEDKKIGVETFLKEGPGKAKFVGR